MIKIIGKELGEVGTLIGNSIKDRLQVIGEEYEQFIKDIPTKEYQEEIPPLSKETKMEKRYMRRLETIDFRIDDLKQLIDEKMGDIEELKGLFEMEPSSDVLDYIQKELQHNEIQLRTYISLFTRIGKIIEEDKEELLKDIQKYMKFKDKNDAKIIYLKDDLDFHKDEIIDLTSSTVKRLKSSWEQFLQFVSENQESIKKGFLAFGGLVASGTLLAIIGAIVNYIFNNLTKKQIANKVNKDTGIPKELVNEIYDIAKKEVDKKKP